MQFANLIDFTDFGYLGLRHRTDELRPWERFSSGRPAVAEDTAVANSLARRLAALQGCAAGTLAPSTLHAFCDLFAALSEDEISIAVDGHAYPIARWGMDRAIARGTPVVAFRHHDPDTLQVLLIRSHQRLKRPVVMVDGISPVHWSAAPLSDYLRRVEHFDGLLVVDDTQAVGLLGHSPTAEAPLGLGGGGSLRWHEIESPHVLVVSSLTKAFGVPIANVSGSRELVDWFRMKSEGRVHCSPVSAPALSAVEHALDVNDACGDELRGRLTGNVRHVQELLGAAGLGGEARVFPVLTVPLPRGTDPTTVDAALQSRGVRALVQRDTCGTASVLLAITADHCHTELEAGVNILRSTFAAQSNQRVNAQSQQDEHVEVTVTASLADE